MWIVQIYSSEFRYMEYHFDFYDAATNFAKIAIDHLAVDMGDKASEVRAVIRKQPSPTRSEEEFVKDEPPFEVDETEEELL